MAHYDTGDVVRLSVVFKDTSHSPIDPTSVCIQVKNPDGSEVHYSYPSSPYVIKTATGEFRYDYLITQSGIHYFKWSGTGNVNAAEEKMFFVKPSQIEGQC